MVMKNWSDFLHHARDANAMRPVDLTFKRGFGVELHQYDIYERTANAK